MYDVTTLTSAKHTSGFFFGLTGIQKLVLAGRVGEAIDATQQLYPGLLEHNPNLLFMLK